MKIASSPLFVFTGILLATAVAALADTVTLKSGEVLNGKILSETDQQLVINVAISAGVMDERTLTKSDIKSAEKTTPDEIAYQAIKDYRPETHSLQPAGYPPIFKTLQAFLTAYPQSPHANDVKKNLEAFKQEEARVKAGDLKWDNRWYTAKEAGKNRYEIGAQMQLSTMRDQAANRDFIGALNTFNQIQKSYSGSTAFPDAVELAQSMMRIAAMDMVAIQNKAKVQEAQFNKGIVLVPEPEKSQMIALRKSQVASAEAAFAAAEKTDVTWKPLLPLAAKSFECLKTTLATEAPLLEKIPVADMRKSLEITKTVEGELKEGHLDDIMEELKEAQGLWPQNSRITILAAEWKAIKAKSTPTPTPSPTPKEAAASPTPGQEKKNSTPHASPKA